jgi:Uma2 family endonuclease
MVAPVAERSLSFEDYLRFPEDGNRHELIGGQHCVTPAPGTRHQRISGRLFGLLYVFLRQQPLGEIFSAPYDVVLSPTDITQPDLLFISTARSSILGEQRVQGAPDLVVEIVSESSRRTDEVFKRNLYERAGVGEYWLLDPEIETVKIYRRTAEGEGFGRPEILLSDLEDQLSTPLLPGFSVALKEIFR